MSVIDRLINARRSHVYFLIAAVLCGALSGCGAEQQSGPAQASTTSVKLKITMPRKVASVSSNSTGFLAKVSQWLFPTEAWAANPGDIVALIVEVTGPGIPDPITKRESVGDLIGGEVVPIVLDVPIGEGRVFTVSAVNAANTTIFHGQSSAMTLMLGQVATANVQLTDVGIVITTTGLPGGREGLSYNATVAAENTSGTVAWFVPQGTLPSALTLNQATGVITGTPTSVGTFTFTVRATDSLASDDQDLSITIAAQLTIITTQLPEGTEGTLYSETLQTAGAVGAVTWSISQEGTLPDGLTLNPSTGEITGTPSILTSCDCSIDTFSFTVVATDSIGQSATQGLQITVVQAPFVTTFQLPTAEVRVQYKDTSSSETGVPVQLSVSGGVAPYTWLLIDSTLPEGISLSSDGIISGEPVNGTGSCDGFSYDTIFQVRDRNGAAAISSGLSIVVYDFTSCSSF